MSDNDGDDELALSLERARADMEIIQSCYPDEISSPSSFDDSSSFPFQFTLHLSSLDVDAKSNSNSNLTLKLEHGYPVASGVQISNYRTDSLKDKARLEAVVRSVRRVSAECQQEEMEGCIACCAVALETWNDYDCQDEVDDGFGNDSTAAGETPPSTIERNHNSDKTRNTKRYEWVTGEPLYDRKSCFVAHICEVHSEQEVKEALHQLLTSSSKIQRATHNMYAWRIAETVSDGDGTRVVIKHDNDDDGESASGSKMAFLLDMRKDENVLVVVSRWYGGVHLGPKRFAHIVNVARELLVKYTSTNRE
ncbi:unnamed protein product [Pseudo-nitzschia multistriata]|uniref:Uncharacterized protein n=1 Tax=Pseudo-nitzschia multistriata TaxID=183589 RepID=A0A448ZRH4_9STRA|nr:unnamed protein product [Pseudo-nitzschia multistriata]